MIRKTFLRIILFFSFIGVLYSIYFIVSHFYEYKIAEKKYEDLKRIFEVSNTDEYQELKRINDDYVGWIFVEGTNIEYPVVLGQNNDYYLNHNFYKEEDRVGAIFMDYRNSEQELDHHTIIYGHNMKDKSMFASLAHVLETDFSEENRIYLDFQNNSYEWEVFSAYVTRDTDWMQIDFENNSNYVQFMNKLKNKSAKNFTIEPTDDNQIITLATCTSRVSDERVVVHARKVE